MSLLKGYNSATDYKSDEYEIKTYDLNCIGIKGDLHTCSFAISDLSYLNSSPEDVTELIRRNLVSKIVDSLLSSNKPYIEFTKRSDPVTGTTYFMARISVVPKDTTQLLKSAVIK